MPTAWVRVYEELNDFLPPQRKQRTFAHDLPEGATVSQLLADLGVPPSDVDLVLAGDISVDLSYRIRDGERVSVYPVFEAFDIAGVTQIRKEPLRETRFIADCTVKRLAAYLRLLGFDTKLREEGIVAPDLVHHAEAERRILLTRNSRLLSQAGVSRIFVLKSRKPREQLQEILSHLDLYHSARPFRRCPSCNQPGLQIRKPQSANLNQLGSCRHCGRIYVQDAHLQRLRWFIGRMLHREGSQT